MTGDSKIRDRRREALRPNKCVGAGQDRSPREISGRAVCVCEYVCVHLTQGQGCDMQGAFGECVAVSPSLWGSASEPLVS